MKPNRRRERCNRADDFKEGVALAERLIYAGAKVVRTGTLLFIGGQGFGQPILEALEKKGLVSRSGLFPIPHVPMAQTSWDKVDGLNS